MSCEWADQPADGWIRECWRLRPQSQGSGSVLDERWLWVTPCVPNVDDEGDPAVMDDRLLPMNEQDKDEWKEGGREWWRSV